MNRRLTAVLAAIGALAIIVVGVSLESDDDGSGDDGPAASETDTDSEATPASETPSEQEPPTQTPTASSTSEESREQERPMTYVGRVRGGAATLAVVVDDEEATAYFCDGVDLEAWLGGRAFAGRLDLSGDTGGLNGSFDGRQSSGHVRVEGRRFGFTLRQVDPPQGLYRFADTIDGAEVKGGWIVLPSGRQVGLLSVDGESRPAPELDPATGQVRVDGQALTVEQLS